MRMRCVCYQTGQGGIRHNAFMSRLREDCSSPPKLPVYRWWLWKWPQVISETTTPNRSIQLRPWSCSKFRGRRRFTSLIWMPEATNVHINIAAIWNSSDFIEELPAQRPSSTNTFGVNDGSVHLGISLVMSADLHVGTSINQLQSIG